MLFWLTKGFVGKLDFWIALETCMCLYLYVYVLIGVFTYMGIICAYTVIEKSVATLSNMYHKNVLLNLEIEIL